MDKLQQIEAEMAKFENEIASRGPQPGGGMPPMGPGGPFPPPMMGRPPMFNNSALRFLPHAVRGAPYAPPAGMYPPPMMGRGPSGPMMMPPMPRPLRPPPPENPPPPPPDESKPTAPPPTNAPVIEGAPTKYSAPGQKAAAVSTVIMPKSLKRGADDTDEPGPSNKAAGTSKVTSSTHGAFTLVDKPVIKVPKKYVRVAGGQVWEDPNLLEWDPNDFRMFAGDLGNEVNDELLSKTFRKYPSFVKAKVVRDKRTNRSKGYGFVSFTDPEDMIRAMREMNGKYVGNHPIKLKKSTWKERDLQYVRKKMRDKKKLGLY